MSEPDAQFSSRQIVVVLAIGAAAVGGLACCTLTQGPALSRYQAVVEEIGRFPDRRETLGKQYECVIDPGPPLRVAFVQHGSILDNWVGIVYDPTGLVLKARQFKQDWSNWDDPALRDVKGVMWRHDALDRAPGGPVVPLHLLVIVRSVRNVLSS